MNSLSLTRRVGFTGLAALVLAGAWTMPASGGAGAATTQGTVVGEGGDAISPVMVKLIHDDAASLAPDLATYTNVDLDQGIADFVGSAPGTFGNDFAVTERKLTPAEAAAATANGRSFAYVPIAAVPVALMTLVPNTSWNAGATIRPTDYCQHIPLTLANLDGIYGSPAYTGWADSNLSCTVPPTTSPASQYSFGLWANLDPTMENYALMSLLDSTTGSTAAFQAGLTSAQAHGQATTTDPTPSEHWPFGKTVPGGDQTTFGKLIGLDALTGVPGTQAALVQLGAIMPVADVWTGDPLGVRWDLPTAAVQNAAQHFVIPTAGAALAAEANASLASTSDPTTNNLVTFNPATTDPNNCDPTGGATPCPYNNWLMMESYLLVPTSGLPADKALALAQFIRFAVGGTGRADIALLGAAGATSHEVTADLAVAQQLDAEAAASGSSTTSTTTTTTAAAASSSSSPGSSISDVPASGTSGGSTSSGTLATTGDNPSLLAGVGLAFLICGELARQLLRRRKAKL
jgi:hypothetical protein